MSRFVRSLLLLVPILALGLAGGARATTMTLEELTMPGATLTAGNLVFSSFDVTFLQNLDPDLSTYTVSSGIDGILIEGDFESPRRDTPAQMTLAFDVATTDRSQIDGAALFFEADAWVEAGVIEQLSNGGGAIDTLQDVVFGIGTGTGGDASSFSPVSSLPVRKEIYTIDANMNMVEQTFHTTDVPEPGALLLLGAGLGGLLMLRRRD